MEEQVFTINVAAGIVNAAVIGISIIFLGLGILEKKKRYIYVSGVLTAVAVLLFIVLLIVNFVPLY